jgi:hypothetical protein
LCTTAPPSAKRADPRRATHTIADPLTGDESDDALLRMPFKEARAAAIDAFEERYVLPLLSAHNTTCPKPRASRASIATTSTA